VDAVHAKGSYIFLQLWAMGRAADIDLLEKQDPPSPYVSASPVTLIGRSKPPRQLTEAEINDYIATFAKAASNAVHVAGFDGVEIHSAHGYLPDQFLQTVSNKRTDRWGGDEEGRTRFTRGVVDAVVEAVGEDRVGIRICPWSDYQGDILALICMLSFSFLWCPDMKMPDPRPTFAYLITALRDMHPKMAYLHVPEPRVAGALDVTPTQDENNDFLRHIWNSGDGGAERVFISAGGYTRETALRTAEDKGELIAFGRLYISNVRAPTLSFECFCIHPSTWTRLPA
jgi:NADPH2 dehydrogenase